MRKLLALAFLIALAVVFWYGGRWYAVDRALQATLIFSTPVTVRPGSAVVHEGIPIGRVDSVSTIDVDRKAVTVEVAREFRHLLRTDSSFREAEAQDAAVIDVSSKVAVGPPLSDRAIVPVKSNEVSKWMEKGADAMRPFSKKVSESAAGVVEWYESGSFDQSLREWRSKVPEWKQQGGAVYERNVADIRKKVEAAEKSLRAAKRDVEADDLRRKFDAWLQSVRG